MSDIIPVNSSDGFTPYLVGFYVDTEHGWVGAYDKRAIESMIAAVREKALHDAADEIERLRADAGRYQWIRDRDVIDWDSLVYCCLPTGYEHPDNAINSSAMLLDAAIDAAKEKRDDQ